MSSDPSVPGLGQPGDPIAWDGSALVLPVDATAAMAQTPAGSLIFAFENASLQNNAGQLTLTSGGNPPEAFDSPALIKQPRVLIRNWQANQLNVTNTSTNTDTPIWIDAFGPGIGAPPIDLPIGEPVTVAAESTLQGTADPKWMQLRLQAPQLAVFGIIGGKPDTSGNNAYAIALNSPDGDTGPPTGKTPPPGYYATAGGNIYDFKFNWGAAVIYVAYFGSAEIVTMAAAPQRATLTLLAL